MSSKMVIIGPSKVGKTALVASLKQSADVIGLEFREEGLALDVLAKNEASRNLFNKVFNLVIDQVLPFAGSGDIINYEISLKANHVQHDLWEQFLGFIGMGEPDEAMIYFPDAPGGALFQGDDEEVDHVVMGKFRTELIENLRDADGLIICLDSSALRRASTDDQDIKKRRQVAIEFSRWIPDVFSEVLEGSSETKLKLKRVCFVMTKSDLWASQEGVDNAEAAVKHRDPYNHAKEILGKAFFNSLKHRFSPDSQVAFCMSSVFGFLDGNPNPYFFTEQKRKDRNRDPKIELDQWRPYNVIEPFVFLLNGYNIDGRLKIMSPADLGR
jgi:hypothetical protein